MPLLTIDRSSVPLVRESRAKSQKLERGPTSKAQKKKRKKDALPPTERQIKTQREGRTVVKKEGGKRQKVVEKWKAE